MKRRLPPGSRLRLPTGTEALRELRHDLRTPLNAIIGYSELIVEDAGDALPAESRTGLQRLAAVGRRMLTRTNALFAEQQARRLEQLTCREILVAFRADAGEVAALAARLERQLRAAGLSVAVRDLRRIRTAAGQWRRRIEELMVKHCA
jgi:signal transduction histidine kinase